MSIRANAALRSIRRLAARFRHDRRGTSAVEFGIVVVPFTALLFAIIETAVVFFSGQVLETAVADAGRLILTGQAQLQGFSQQQFKDSVCSRIPALFDCQSMVTLDVRTFPSFANATVPPPVTNGKLDTSTFGYSPGGPGQIVVVRAAMEYPIYVTLLNPNIANLTNGKRLIMASTTFRNEPYTSN
jgi:Flp pilus assembly protein TadG